MTTSMQMFTKDELRPKTWESIYLLTIQCEMQTNENSLKLESIKGQFFYELNRSKCLYFILFCVRINLFRCVMHFKCSIWLAIECYFGFRVFPALNSIWGLVISDGNVDILNVLTVMKTIFEFKKVHLLLRIGSNDVTAQIGPRNLCAILIVSKSGPTNADCIFDRLEIFVVFSESIFELCLFVLRPIELIPID